MSGGSKQVDLSFTGSRIPYRVGKGGKADTITFCFVGIKIDTVNAVLALPPETPLNFIR